MSSDPMASLIGTVNKLQDAFTLLGYDPLSLPQICVVGGQSSGKSSVLENIVGRDFLPRGSGIVTRRPLVIQLVNDPKSTADVGEFLHKAGEFFTDYEDIKAEIEAATDAETGTNKGISSRPINLKITSSRVLNLTLVDLPGMTRVAVGDQPADIGKQIEAMVMEFITKEKAIILAVTPANSDLANSDALRVAREVDPDGLRTVGVITKCDIMDRGTNAMDILEGKVIPLRLGYVAVVNRAQEDINLNKKIDDQWAAEKQYFASHNQYSRIADRCGTEYLTKMLNRTLTGHIRASLPEIMAKIEVFMVEKEEELTRLAEMSDVTAMQRLVLRSLSKYSENFAKIIHGMEDDVAGDHLTGGAKMSVIFHQQFGKSMLDMEVLNTVTNEKIQTVIANSKGLSGGLFIPEKAFESLVRLVVAKLEKPALQCVQAIFDELINIANTVETEGMERFDRMRTAVQDAARELLRGQLGDTNSLVRTLIAMEACRINTRHPDFLESRKKAKQLVLAADAENKRVQRERRAGPNVDFQAGEADPEEEDAGPTPLPRKAAPVAPGKVPMTPPSVPVRPPNAVGRSKSFKQPGSRPAAPSAANKPRFTVADTEANVNATDDLEVIQVRKLLEAYFKIVSIKVADSIPKAIVLKLVKTAHEDMHDHLVATLYKEEIMSELLEESAETISRRASCREILKLMKSSLMAIQQVQKEAAL